MANENTIVGDMVIRIDGKGIQITTLDANGNAGENTFDSSGKMFEEKDLVIGKAGDANDQVVLWDKADSLVDKFKMLVILGVVKADQVECEFVVDAGGAKTKNYTEQCRTGFPIVKPSGVARDSDHTLAWAADGAQDEIEKIEAKNFGPDEAIVKIVVIE